MVQTPCNHNSNYNNNNISSTNSNNAGIQSRRRPERGTRIQTDGTMSMPKRGLIDRIPKVLTIDVTTASNVATVNVLSAVREHGVLQPTPEQISMYSLWH